MNFTSGAAETKACADESKTVMEPKAPEMVPGAGTAVTFSTREIERKVLAT